MGSTGREEMDDHIIEQGKRFEEKMSDKAIREEVSRIHKLALQRHSRLCRMAGNIASGFVEAGLDSELIATLSLNVAVEIEKEAARECGLDDVSIGRSNG